MLSVMAFNIHKNLYTEIDVIIFILCGISYASQVSYFFKPLFILHLLVFNRHLERNEDVQIK